MIPDLQRFVLNSVGDPWHLGADPTGLWIRIHFWRIRIQSLMWRPIRIRIPDSDPIRDQDFNDQKLKKNYSWQFFYYFFWSKTAIYFSLGLHKVCPSYRRSLQFSKEAIQHFKTWTFTNYCLLLWVIFSLLDPDPNPDPDPQTPIEYGSNPDPGSGSTTLGSESADLYGTSLNALIRIHLWYLKKFWIPNTPG